MHDPRKPRPLKPRTLNVLVADANNFSRGLIGEILRNLNITNIFSARSAELAVQMLIDRPSIDLILLAWDEGEAFDPFAFVRGVRKLDDDRLRRLPIVLVTAGLTRQLVIQGRDAGVDEFLNKPISPVALKQRLEMVIETPRPFVDCSVYLGPCRRRKNPADYYGEKRRAGERVSAGPAMVDQDELAKETPIRLALSNLRQTCAHLRASRPEALATAMDQTRIAKEIAVEQKDHALHAGLASFESYIAVATPLGQLDEVVITTALTALEQLAALPITFADARNSVAIALGKAIQKKLAA
jgi:CheY-like chemotaxis protein